jgi:hypothetical protein
MGPSTCYVRVLNNNRRAWGQSNTRPAAQRAAERLSYPMVNEQNNGLLQGHVLRIMHAGYLKSAFILGYPTLRLQLIEKV